MRAPRKTKAEREIDRLQRDCAEAYQVVGVLAHHAGLLGHRDVIRAMDNLAAAAAGRRRPHSDMLHFPKRPFRSRKTTPEYPAGSPKQAPTHPGELIREIIIEHLKMTIIEAARRMGIDRRGLQAVMRAKQGVTAEMALRFARIAGGKPNLYLQMQKAYDLWHAEHRSTQSAVPARGSRTTSRGFLS